MMMTQAHLDGNIALSLESRSTIYNNSSYIGNNGNYIYVAAEPVAISYMWVINPSPAIALDMSAKAHEWELDRSAAEMAERKGENAFATKC